MFIPSRGGVLSPSLSSDPQGWAGLTARRRLAVAGWLGSSLLELGPLLAAESTLRGPERRGLRSGGAVGDPHSPPGSQSPSRSGFSLPPALVSDTDNLTLIHMLGGTHPDTHLHRHTHLRTQYTSRQHTAYTPRPERQPPRCLPQRPPPGALLSRTRHTHGPYDTAGSALTLRSTQPPIHPFTPSESHRDTCSLPFLGHTLSSQIAAPIIKHHVLLLVPSALSQAFVRMITVPLGLAQRSATPGLPHNLPISGAFLPQP